MSDWFPSVQLSKKIDRDDGRVLMIFVTQHEDKWGAGAVETSSQSFEGGIKTVFDDHAHKIVGRYPTMRGALDAADSFAAAWLKNWKATRTEQCDCGEIANGKKATARREPRVATSRRSRQPTADEDNTKITDA